MSGRGKGPWPRGPYRPTSVLPRRTRTQPRRHRDQSPRPWSRRDLVWRTEHTRHCHRVRPERSQALVRAPAPVTDETAGKDPHARTKTPLHPRTAEPTQTRQAPGPGLTVCEQWPSARVGWPTQHRFTGTRWSMRWGSPVPSRSGRKGQSFDIIAEMLGLDQFRGPAEGLEGNARAFWFPAFCRVREGEPCGARPRIRPFASWVWNLAVTLLRSGIKALRGSEWPGVAASGPGQMREQNRHGRGAGLWFR